MTDIEGVLFRWRGTLAPADRLQNQAETAEISLGQLKIMGAKATTLLTLLRMGDIRTAIVADDISRAELDRQADAMGLDIGERLVSYVSTKDTSDFNDTPQDSFGRLLTKFNQDGIPTNYLLYAGNHPDDAKLADEMGVQFIGISPDRATKQAFRAAKQPWLTDISDISIIR